MCTLSPLGWQDIVCTLSPLGWQDIVCTLSPSGCQDIVRTLNPLGWQVGTGQEPSQYSPQSQPRTAMSPRRTRPSQPNKKQAPSGRETSYKERSAGQNYRVRKEGRLELALKSLRI